MNRQTATHAIPSRLTPAARKPSLGLWKVTSQVQSTSYSHKWAGDAIDSSDAKARALDSARRAWPGFCFVVRSVVQVA